MRNEKMSTFSCRDFIHLTVHGTVHCSENRTSSRIAIMKFVARKTTLKVRSCSVKQVRFN